jgi:hypothetical protein
MASLDSTVHHTLPHPLLVRMCTCVRACNTVSTRMQCMGTWPTSKQLLCEWVQVMQCNAPCRIHCILSFTVQLRVIRSHRIRKGVLLGCARYPATARCGRCALHCLTTLLQALLLSYVRVCWLASVECVADVDQGLVGIHACVLVYRVSGINVSLTSTLIKGWHTFVCAGSCQWITEMTLIKGWYPFVCAGLVSVESMCHKR